MSRRLSKNLEVLKFINASEPGVRSKLLKKASPELVDCCSEICLNTLRGNVPLKPHQKKRLARHKSAIRDLANKKTPLNRKRAHLQKGGFLGALLTPLIGKILGPLAKTLLG